MARLGQAGVWEELQTIKHASGDVKLKGQSRMRWTRSGRCIINEGVVYTENGPEYFLWVKTWDAVEKHYRYAYFFEDGPVHHFVGQWNPQAKSIHWQSIQPPGAIEIREFVKQRGERSWTFTVMDGSNTTLGAAPVNLFPSNCWRLIRFGKGLAQDGNGGGQSVRQFIQPVLHLTRCLFLTTLK